MTFDLTARRRRLERTARRTLGLAHAHLHPGIPDGAAVLVHVGKSGGSSLRSALERSELGEAMYTVHMQPPPVRSSLTYYIVARGPVERAVSAFNWRYKLVVTDGSQRHRIPGEYELLTAYGTLNALALDLYSEDGVPNRPVIAAFARMHHIRESLAFYLEDLLAGVRPEQIRDVLMQETLDSDIARVFGVESTHRSKSHAASLDPAALSLEARARGNLMRFLDRDYACLARLLCWGKIDREVYLRTL